MKIEIKNEKYNRFLKRKELGLDIDHPEETTPSAAAIQQLVAKQFNSDVDKTEVREIFSALGSPTSKSVVFVWDEKTVKDLSKKEGKPIEEDKVGDKEKVKEAKEVKKSAE